MKYPTWLSLLFCSAVLAGCGGGGGSSSANGSSGGGSTGTPTTVPAPLPPGTNVQALVIDLGPNNSRGVSVNSRNSLYVSVTVCVPGSPTQCQTIDHVLLDTGSSGLRLLASALPSSFVLPAVKTTLQQPVAGCGQFANSYTWGSVRQADVRLASELAASSSVQVIGDAAFPSVPASCSNGLPGTNSIDTLKANGLLGISTFLNDCGPACETTSVPGSYYVCPSSGCRSTPLPVAQQVGNPVAKFAVNNNGTLIQLPAVGPAGADSVAGSLTFGIGTQANNALGSASVYTLDSGGNMSTVYDGKKLPSFMDSGSNGLFFDDSSIATCGNGFFCPPSTLALSAVNTGSNGTNGTINFSVANANALTQANPGYAAFSNLAGPGALSSYFDWGLPFYFGRTVYTAIEGRTAGVVTGPYVAY